MESSSASASDATASSQSGTATTSQSGAPAPTGSGTNSTEHPIPEIEYHGTIYADPPLGGGRRIRMTGRYDLCLTVQGGSNTANAVVAMWVADQPQCAPLMAQRLLLGHFRHVPRRAAVRL